jgi:hypothetical protein
MAWKTDGPPYLSCDIADQTQKDCAIADLYTAIDTKSQAKNGSDKDEEVRVDIDCEHNCS